MKNIFYKIFIIAYSSIFLINEFYTIDRLGPQTIVLSILNFICLFYLSSRVRENIDFTEFRLKLSSITTHYLIIFLSMIIFSFSAINTSEAIITLNHYFNLIISLYCLIILMQRIENLKKFILYSILTLLFIESGYIFFKIIEYYNLGDLWLGGFNRNFYVRGFTGNINISAFSLAYKIPFLCYGFLIEKKLFIKIIISIFFIVSIIDIFHLGSRGAILALLTTIIIYSIFIFRKKSLVYILLLCAIGFGVSYLLLRKSENLNPIERTNSISFNTTDGSVDSRLRYYKEILTYLVENSFKPIGIGMYKLYSVDFEKEYITDYRVPYHSHNDFLEIGSETGIFGMIAFILLLIYPLIFFEKEINIKNLILLFSFIIYIFDSLINFPFARPANILIFLLILAFSYKKIELIKNA